MQQQHGDITEVKRGIICHQVNCQGVMGAGLALQIRRKFPTAYAMYMDAYAHGGLILGAVIFCPIKQNLIVANICGQYYYGRNRQYTDYEAVAEGIAKVRHFASSFSLPAYASLANFPIYIPFNMGCALAGGNWEVVSKIIETHIPYATIVIKE